MATKTNTGLVAYATAQIGNPYWYGTFGQVATEALLKSKMAQYPRPVRRLASGDGAGQAHR